MDEEIEKALDALVGEEKGSDSSPLRDGYSRYHNLASFELRAVRDCLRALSERADSDYQGEVRETVRSLQASHVFNHYAAACDHLLDWVEYDWNWHYILEDSETIRSHAERVENALDALPEARCKRVFVRAMRYTTYDREIHEEAAREYKVSNFTTKIRAKLKTIPEAWDDPEEVEHRTVRRVYKKAGWSGAREGGREELSALTDAILWARKD